MKRTIDGLLLLLFIVHYLFFPIRLRKEHFFISDRALDIRSTQSDPEEFVDSLVSFELSGYLGYIDSEFVLRSKLLLMDRVEHSSYGYVLYNGEYDNNYYNYHGQMVGSMMNRGVPFLFKDSLYFVDSPIGQISHYSVDGDPLWSYEVGAFVSSFDVNKEFVVIGDMSGYLTILDHQGGIVGRYNVPGSEHEGIYGVRISPSSQYIAIIGGVNPQRFILFRRTSSGYNRIAHEKMDELRRTVAIHFDEKENFVYYEGKGKIFIFEISDNPKSGSVRELMLGGKDLVEFLPNLMDKFFAVVSRSNNKQCLQIYSKDGRYSFVNIPFVSDNDILLLRNKNQIIMGLEHILMRVSWK